MAQGHRIRGLASEAGYQAETLNKRRGHLMWPRREASSLGLADAEYCGPAFWARALGRGALVLHDDLLWILDFHLLLALHAVCLCHSFQPPLLQDLR